MPTPVHEQLLAAFKDSNLTLEELLAKAELEMDIASLSRKLHGKQILTTKEAESIAQALMTSFAWKPRRGAASS